MERTRGNGPHRLDDDRVAVVDPFVRLEKLVALREILRHIAPLHRVAVPMTQQPASLAIWRMVASQLSPVSQVGAT